MSESCCFVLFFNLVAYGGVEIDWEDNLLSRQRYHVAPGGRMSGGGFDFEVRKVFNFSRWAFEFETRCGRNRSILLIFNICKLSFDKECFFMFSMQV